jgi:hypothetical protein
MGYAAFLARKPWVVLVLSILPSILCVLVLVVEQGGPKPVSVDLGWGTFQVDGSEVTERVRAAEIASALSYEKLRTRVEPSRSLLAMGGGEGESIWGHSRALTQAAAVQVQDKPRRVYSAESLFLLYVMPDQGDDILQPVFLDQIRTLEQAITTHPLYLEFCRTFPSGPDLGECSPPNSIMSFLYPSLDGGEWVYDGRGATLVEDVPAMTRALLRTGRTGKHTHTHTHTHSHAHTPAHTRHTHKHTHTHTGFTDRSANARDAEPESQVLVSKVRFNSKG